MADLVDRSVLAHKAAQASGVLLVALGVFLTISLLSYSPGDFPNSSRAASEVLNWGGRLGAYAAYVAFLGIGYGAYVVPILAFMWGWNRLRDEPVMRTAYRSAGLLGAAVLFSVAAGLPDYPVHTAFEWGGWLGTRTSSAILIPYGGRVGSSILLGACFIAALIVSTDIDPRVGLKYIRVGATAAGTVGRRFSGVLVRLGSYRPKRRIAARKPVEEAPEPDLEEELETPAPVKSLPREEAEVAKPAAKRKVKVAIREAEPVVEEPVVEAPPKRRRPKPAVKGGGGKYVKPTLDLLSEVPADRGGVDREQLEGNAEILEEAMHNFDVAGKVVEVSPGPVVTRYEVEPAAGVKVNRIVTLADDLARVMSAQGIRIQAPVPGRKVVGVEIANSERETVYLREILESNLFRRAESKLTMALGKTIEGKPYLADLAKMPHLLVAGATGAGKSVCINCLISSMLYKATPEEVRLIMIDPKVVELTMYNGIPHLMVPVITDPKQASEALKWAVAEMEARYQKLARMGVRNLADYNRKLKEYNARAEEEGAEPEKSLPYIVIFIDEFADLMLTAPADVETSLMSLAQKSRAVGLHIILATQRPSVNVITGVIKANFPSRIAFQVATKIDSRTIIDTNGAERLLGRGDMLFLPGGQGEPVRVHGAFMSGEETEAIVDAIKASGYQAEEVAIFSEHADIKAAQDGQDELFDEAVKVVVEAQQASTSFLQRRMKVGYSRAARLMDELEAMGIVGPAEGAKPRQVLADESEFGDLFSADEEFSAKNEN